MKAMICRAPDGAEFNGRRIGFLCHPDDLFRCLDTFCADVFRLD